jgi:hypothetical protein
VVPFQEAGTSSKPQSRPYTSRFSQHDLETRVNKLLDASISTNTMAVYETGLKSFSNVCKEFGLEQMWSTALESVVQFIAYLSCKKCSHATAKTCLSSISFQCKIKNWIDMTLTFIVMKLLEGMYRLKKTTDARMPITVQLLSKIVQALQCICFNNYEAKLVRATYLQAFFGFLRVWSLSVGNDVQSLLQVIDVIVLLKIIQKCSYT